MSKFPHYQQLDAMDCGATCLRMIAKYYGRLYTAQTLRQRSSITREGVSLLGISDAAESIGMRTMGVKTTLENLEKEKVTPFIAHWNQNHFVVVYKIDKKNSYVINYDGYVHKCVARDYTTPLASISDDGDILFNDHANDYSARNVFDIQTCVNCKELPMCFGPCLQKIVENTNLEDACVLKLSETKVEDYIKIRAYEVIKKI